MKFEALLAEATDTSIEEWTLSDWSSQELIDSSVCIQRINSLLNQGYLVSKQYYALEDAMLVALYKPTDGKSRHYHDEQTDSVVTKLGFSNYLTYVSPINLNSLENPSNRASDASDNAAQASEFPSRPPTSNIAQGVVGYDVGDSVISIATQRHQFYPKDGSTIMAELSTFADKTGFAKTSLILVRIIST